MGGGGGGAAEGGAGAAYFTPLMYMGCWYVKVKQQNDKQNSIQMNK